MTVTIGKASCNLPKEVDTKAMISDTNDEEERCEDERRQLDVSGCC